MTLRDKTNQKFKSFFEKMAKIHHGEEFEVAFSEIQRETGSAHGTMKRALEFLEAENWLEVKPGRNSRYGLFRVPSLEIPPETATPSVSLKEKTEAPSEKDLVESPENTEESAESSLDNQTREPEAPEQSPWVEELAELEGQVNSLRRRIRTQEMMIALLQERVAELEDKLFKK